MLSLPGLSQARLWCHLHKAFLIPRLHGIHPLWPPVVPGTSLFAFLLQRQELKPTSWSLIWFIDGSTLELHHGRVHTCLHLHAWWWNFEGNTCVCLPSRSPSLSTPAPCLELFRCSVNISLLGFASWWHFSKHTACGHSLLSMRIFAHGDKEPELSNAHIAAELAALWSETKGKQNFLSVIYWWRTRSGLRFICEFNSVPWRRQVSDEAEFSSPQFLLEASGVISLDYAHFQVRLWVFRALPKLPENCRTKSCSLFPTLSWNHLIIECDLRHRKHCIRLQTFKHQRAH